VPPPAIIDEPAAPSTPAGGWWSTRRRLIGLVVTSVLAVAGVAAVEIIRPDGRPEPPPGSWTVMPHRGLGAWVDVYDWTEEFGGRSPSVDLADIDAMAEAGVQTVYLQTSHQRSTADVIEPERLDALIDAAHSNDMHVVAWYLPTLVNLDRDLRRLIAAAELAVDGLGVDIEAIDVADAAERNERVIDLTARLRTALGEDRALAAITLSSVHVQVVNPDYWPGYPWAELAATYDAILPMAYWSIRRDELRAGLRYVSENIDRIRASAGRDDLLIHAIGGIADEATVADVEGMLAAIQDRGVIGGSLYDWNTSTVEQWAALQPLRDLRPASE
jgi:hypothetical protein